ISRVRSVSVRGRDFALCPANRRAKGTARKARIPCPDEGNTIASASAINKLYKFAIQCIGYFDTSQLGYTHPPCVWLRCGERLQNLHVRQSASYDLASISPKTRVLRSSSRRAGLAAPSRTMARPAFHNRAVFSRGVNAGLILRYGV